MVFSGYCVTSIERSPEPAPPSPQVDLPRGLYAFLGVLRGLLRVWPAGGGLCTAGEGRAGGGEEGLME